MPKTVIARVSRQEWLEWTIPAMAISALGLILLLAVELSPTNCPLMASLNGDPAPCPAWDFHPIEIVLALLLILTAATIAWASSYSWRGRAFWLTLLIVALSLLVVGGTYAALMSFPGIEISS